MSRESRRTSDEMNTEKGRQLAKKFGAVGWALFFIWVGIAFLTNIGFGAGLLGVGIITLGIQAARRYYGLELEGVWIVIGLLFVVGGLWELLELKLPLVPIVLVVAGLALLVSTLRGKHPESK